MKVSTFDTEYAKLIGVPTGILFYAFMSLTSLTTVAAFDAVGSILVISFFIAPAATALLFTKNLTQTLIISVIFSMINSIIGYEIAVHTNASIAGLCAVVNTLVYMLALLVNPKGFITTYIRRARNRKLLREELFILHIGKHTAEDLHSPENHAAQIGNHLKWGAARVRAVTNALLSKGELEREGDYYLLTERGAETYRMLCSRYYI